MRLCRQGAGYVFSVVGTSRCDVRAACSGAAPSNASVVRLFVPPATTRAGTARRAIPTIAVYTYESPRYRRRRAGAGRNSVGQFGLPGGIPNWPDHVAGVV